MHLPPSLLSPILRACSGWYNLETSYAAYRALIEGYGGRYLHLIRESPGAYRTFVAAAGGHLNRYVRQAACELIGVIGQCSLSVPPPPAAAAAAEGGALSSQLLRLPSLGSTQQREGEQEQAEEEEEGLFPLGLFANVLGAGMEDSWCQVRLASTQAAAVLLRWVKHLCPLSSPLPSFLPLWVLLVPRLCLNRHYSTDSVRYCPAAE